PPNPTPFIFPFHDLPPTVRPPTSLPPPPVTNPRPLSPIPTRFHPSPHKIRTSSNSFSRSNFSFVFVN
ncbi:hypothetical protein LINGRAHAP2_LOCUS34837, partial [Linum grandiflorum]